MTATRQQLRRLAREAQRRIFRPRPRLTVSEWADRFRVLSPEASAEVGRWRTDRAPYLREIMDTLGDDRVEHVVFAKSAQVGGTEVLNNYLGYLLAEDPCPILIVQPTVEMAKAWSKERLDPMLRDTPRLRGLLPATGRRTKDQAIQFKRVPGGFIAILGANSPAGLASRPIRVAGGDERDRWPASAGEEGDPWTLLTARTTTFWNRKLIEISTPTWEETSAIWSSFGLSDQRYYHVRCPHCEFRQRLVWRDPDGSYRLVCDRDAHGALIPETAQYRCEECAALIEERWKPAMLADGQWVPSQPGRGIAGFHISALYSPWKTWAEVVRDFVRVRGNEERLKGFVNTVLGLPFAPKTAQVNPQSLAARAEVVPPGLPEFGALTIGVDVQPDRLELVVSAWSAEETSFVLEWRQLYGDTAQDPVWLELRAVLDERWHGLGVAALAIDSGYLPQRAWRFYDALPASWRFRCLVTKGMPGPGRPLVQAPAAVRSKRARHPWLVGVDTAKDLLLARLTSDPKAPGVVRFAETLDPVFYDQLTAERQSVKHVMGRPVRHWELIPHRRNEALDCWILSAAALYGARPALVPRLAALAAAREAAAAAPPPAADPAPRRAIPLEEDNFVERWTW